MPLAPLLVLLLAAAPATATAPEQFFVGRTEGAGTVQMIMAGSHKVRDRSRGRLDRTGALILEQVVEEAGSPPAAAPGASSAPAAIGPARHPGLDPGSIFFNGLRLNRKVDAGSSRT
jgi:hypothetical protein